MSARYLSSPAPTHTQSRDCQASPTAQAPSRDQQSLDDNKLRQPAKRISAKRISRYSHQPSHPPPREHQYLQFQLTDRNLGPPLSQCKITRPPRRVRAQAQTHPQLASRARRRRLRMSSKHRQSASCICPNSRSAAWSCLSRKNVRLPREEGSPETKGRFFYFLFQEKLYRPLLLSHRIREWD